MVVIPVNRKHGVICPRNSPCPRKQVTGQAETKGHPGHKADDFFSLEMENFTSQYLNFSDNVTVSFIFHVQNIKFTMNVRVIPLFFVCCFGYV